MADRAIHDFEIRDDTSERIEHGVENQGLQRRVLIADGGGNTLHYGAKNIVDALARSAGGADNLLALAAEQFNDFIFHLLGHRVRHVALVEHGDNFEVVLYGHI